MSLDGTQAVASGSVPAVTRRTVGSEWRVAAADAWRAFWVTRLLVWVVAMNAVVLWGTSPRRVVFDPGGMTRPFASLGDLLVSPAARWDTVWFLRVAAHGYPAADTERTAFFPLYPLLLRAGKTVTGSELVAGILISSLAFYVALVVLHRLTAIELGPAAARAAVWLAALFPASFFFSAVYSEALFLVLSVSAVYAARTDHWAWAGLLGALGAATRSAGVLLVVPLVLLYVRGRRRSPKDAAWVGLVPLGLGAFCGWLALTGGDASAPLHAQAEWFRHFTGPLAGVRDATVAAWDGARQLLSGSRSPVYFERAGGDPLAVAGHNVSLFAFLLAAVGPVVGVLRRLPFAYGAYVLCALALPLSFPAAPQPLMSLPRFLAVLFPLFMWLGWWATRGRGRQPVLVGVFVAGLVVSTAQFATWHWVA